MKTNIKSTYPNIFLIIFFFTFSYISMAQKSIEEQELTFQQEFLSDVSLRELRLDHKINLIIDRFYIWDRDKECSKRKKYKKNWNSHERMKFDSWLLGEYKKRKLIYQWLTFKQYFKHKTKKPINSSDKM